jgi:hypothetical protein
LKGKRLVVIKVELEKFTEKQGTAEKSEKLPSGQYLSTFPRHLFTNIFLIYQSLVKVATERDGMLP